MSNHEKKLNQKYTLKLSLKLSLITLLLSFILVYLGTWQIGRAREKENILVRLAQKSKLPAIKLEHIKDPALIQDRFSNVTVTGVFLNNYSFLLDNQMLDHKVGFRILTPMQTPKLTKWIIVDRGWIPRNTDRNIIPKIESIYGLQEMVGIINTIPSGIILKKDSVNPSTAWPRVIQRIDYELLSQDLKHPIFDFVVQLNTNGIDFGISSSKHMGYAMQWFIFASILIIYYLIVSIKREPKL